ncbi:hypothetical protein [Breznakia pachnodae]|uniref:Lipoprotein n=1 Tax=Breznakia pachnodae TaxID=265178 RepID=A0ABU0DYQ3_9FIRM|nr:hypothetical protein [Breznakia pachnodae]MDQ0359435.1 hypothetical protein [Breznakia pachnodae]
MKKIVVLIFCLGLLPLFGCTKNDMKNGAEIIEELKSNGVSIDTAEDNSSSILIIPGGSRFHTLYDDSTDYYTIFTTNDANTGVYGIESEIYASDNCQFHLQTNESINGTSCSNEDIDNAKETKRFVGELLDEYNLTINDFEAIYKEMIK